MISNKIKILLIDDDKYFRTALKQLLGDHALCTEVESEAQAIEIIASEHFDMALIDMDIDGPKSGLNILKHTKNKKIHSIILSSQNEEATIEEAYLGGCDHFLGKLHYRTHLEPYIYKFKNNLSGTNLDNFFSTSFITQDSEIIESVTSISEINLKNKTVFISGETGVGKSLIGELLHSQTYDKSKPFIHLNCSEIPENLIESELFGHTKGSFTGAINNKIGKLELANGGTLFLDEIGTMPISMQQKLLKALDSHTFYPVGSQKEIHSDFTLISATCEDLFEKIHNNEFRKDLFFRVSGINLHIKPLRERTNDIPLLTKHFINRSPRRFIIKDCALELLQKQDWPGNIRELKKYIELLSSRKDGIISSEHLTFNSNQLNSDSSSEHITESQLKYINEHGLRDFIKLVEEESIKNSLKKHQGKITHTIKELRISASAFYRIFNNIKINI
jgi:DNA-binding NtrC family response regulator